ncbi:MAG TPA: RNA degradosome polyphosphate kinase, partial [Spirochaetota bacterium]|nr:RNA degradosome polyphosphate kinase [Spirochaetota bacterium]
FPIEDKDIKSEILTILKISLSDNLKARELTKDGTYLRKKGKSGDKKIRSQIELHDYFSERNRKKENLVKRAFIPRMNPDDDEEKII